MQSGEDFLVLQLPLRRRAVADLLDDAVEKGALAGDDVVGEKLAQPFLLDARDVAELHLQSLLALDLGDLGRDEQTRRLDVGVLREMAAIAAGEVANSRAPASSPITALKSSLSQCLEPAENGQTRLTITLPGQEALETMARALATLMAAGKEAAAF